MKKIHGIKISLARTSQADLKWLTKGNWLPADCAWCARATGPGGESEAFRASPQEAYDALIAKLSDVDVAQNVLGSLDYATVRGPQVGYGDANRHLCFPGKVIGDVTGRYGYVVPKGHVALCGLTEYWNGGYGPWAMELYASTEGAYKALLEEAGGRPLN